MAMPMPLRSNEEYVKKLEASPIKEGNVLLYGSSFFRRWGVERSREQWAAATGGALQVVNRGFGGATVDELLYYYNRLVLPCNPSAMVLRTGINDIFHGLNAEQCWFQTERLIEWARADFPGIRFVALDMFDTPSTCAVAEHAAELRRYNEIMDAYAAENDFISTLDINAFFYKSAEDVGTGKNFREFFLEDGLHLTDTGYEEAAQYLAPKVQALLSL